MSEAIAHVFKIDDYVEINSDATAINGDPLPQAGQRGKVVELPKPDRAMIDVPGFPLVNLHADYFRAAAAGGSAPSVGAPALLTPAAAAVGATGVAYAFDVAEMAAIVPSLSNPRTVFEPTPLLSLSDDIKANGILQPILVRRLPAGRLGETFADRREGDPLPDFEIVAGERRFRASKMAGVRSVPILIRDLTDEQVLRMQLVENVQREDLHPLEEARGYRRILDIEGQSTKPMKDRVAELAESVSKSTRYVYQTLQLLHLCDFAQQVFLEGKLLRTTALQVATIGNQAGQIEATRRIAGLGSTGTNVEAEPLSQRAAASYVHNYHQLVLSKAPFPIKLVLEDAPACGECPKNSANARELFDESAKSPDTCMDRSCYGRKNKAHTAALTVAAKAKGQRVISGDAAKKLLPYEYDTAPRSEFTSLDERAGWDEVGDKNYGKTYRQLLGKDIPLPVLIEHPTHGTVIEALAKADVVKLLGERGLLADQSGAAKSKANAKAEEKKAKLETAYRGELAQSLLSQAALIDDVDLFDDLILPAVIELYKLTSHECTLRVHKLMGWGDEVNFGYGAEADSKRLKFFEKLSHGDLNKFLIATCISGELRFAEHYKSRSTNLDYFAGLLKIDAKAMKARLQDEQKAKDNARAESEKAKAVRAAKKASPPKHDLLAFSLGQKVRFKMGLKGPAGILRKVCGREGEISSSSSDGYMVRTGPNPTDVHVAKSFELDAIPQPKAPSKSQWHDPTPAELKALGKGDRVRVTSDKAKLSKLSTPFAGIVGTLHSQAGALAWFLDVAKQGAAEQLTKVSIHVDELQLAGAGDTSPPPATKTAGPAGTKKPAASANSKKPAAKPAKGKAGKPGMQGTLELPTPDETALRPADLAPRADAPDAPKKAASGKPAIKYRGPAGENWNGRGLMPKWLSVKVAAGQSKEDFAVVDEGAPAAKLEAAWPFPKATQDEGAADAR